MATIRSPKEIWATNTESATQALLNTIDVWLQECHGVQVDVIDGYAVSYYNDYEGGSMISDRAPVGAVIRALVAAGHTVNQSYRRKWLFFKQPVLRINLD